MASSLESNRSRTCCRVSDELVHPMSGSTALGEDCSKSSTHDLVLAVPDCIAVLAGLYMRAVVMNGGALRLVSAAWHTGTGPAVKARQRRVGSAGKSGRCGALRSTIGRPWSGKANDTAGNQACSQANGGSRRLQSAAFS